MLDLLLQIAAACGPIALAVMGVVVSLNPPSGSRKAHRIWAGAFALVGILSASAIFFELRGTDQILGQIWEHIKEPQPDKKTGARIFFTVGGFTKDKKKLQVGMINNGDVLARVGAIVAAHSILEDRILSEKEEHALYDAALKGLPPMGSGLETSVGMNRTVDIDLPNLTDAQYDNIINGTAYLYVVVVINFRDEVTPSDKTNLASVCTHFSKNTESGLACFSHTESRIQN
jgi:hypothetical protein